MTKRFSLKKSSSPSRGVEISSPALIHAAALRRNDLIPIEHVNNNGDLEAVRREMSKTKPPPQQQQDRYSTRTPRFSFNMYDEEISVPPHHHRLSWAPGDLRARKGQSSIQRKASIWNRISGFFRGKQPIETPRDGGGDCNSLNSATSSTRNQLLDDETKRDSGLVHGEMKCVRSHRQIAPESSLLQVDIPCAKMERYSVMFGDILDYPKRQSVASKFPSVPEEKREAEENMHNNHSSLESREEEPLANVNSLGEKTNIEDASRVIKPRLHGYSLFPAHDSGKGENSVPTLRQRARNTAPVREISNDPTHTTRHAGLTAVNDHPRPQRDRPLSQVSRVEVSYAKFIFLSKAQKQILVPGGKTASKASQ